MGNPGLRVDHHRGDTEPVVTTAMILFELRMGRNRKTAACLFSRKGSSMEVMSLVID